MRFYAAHPLPLFLVQLALSHFTLTDVTDILGGERLVTSGKFSLRTFETVLEEEDAQHGVVHHGR